MTKIADIVIDPQVRKDLGDLSGLKASISSIGVINPVIVETHDDGTVHLVAGERRLRASQELGLADIPTIEKDADALTVEVQISENLHRKALTPLEEAQAVLALSDDYTQKQIESVTGIPSKEQTQMKKRAKAAAELVDAEAYEILNLFTESGVDDFLRYQVDVPEGSSEVEVRSEMIRLMKERNVNVYGASSELRKEQRKAHWVERMVPLIAQLRDNDYKELPDKANNTGYSQRPQPKVSHQARQLSTDEAKKHEGEPCFGFWVDEGSFTLEFWCTNWLRHAEGADKSELVIPEATSAFESKEQNRAVNREQRLRGQARIEAQRQFVTEKRAAKVFADWAFHLASEMRYDDWTNLGRVLGLPVEERTEGGVTRYCEEAKLDLHRVAIAYHIVSEMEHTYSDEYASEAVADLLAAYREAKAAMFEELSSEATSS